MDYTTAQIHLHCSASAAPKAVQSCTMTTKPKVTLYLTSTTMVIHVSEMLPPSCIAFMLKEEKKEEKAAPKEEKPEPKEEKAQPPPKEEKPQPPKQETKPPKPAPSKVQLLPHFTSFKSSSCDHQVMLCMQQNMDFSKSSVSQDANCKQHTHQNDNLQSPTTISVLHRVLHQVEPRPHQTSQQASQGGLRGG